jgi:hypothetical protein
MAVLIGWLVVIPVLAVLVFAGQRSARLAH